MNRKLYFSAICICFLQVMQSQGTSTVKEIDELVSTIKTQTYSSKKEKKSDKAYKFLFFNDTTLLAQEVTDSGSIIKKVGWYFHENELIYTETTWYKPESEQILFQEKSYHHKGSLIAWLKSENTFVDSRSPEFSKFEKEINVYVSKIKSEAFD